MAHLPQILQKIKTAADSQPAPRLVSTWNCRGLRGSGRMRKRGTGFIGISSSGVENTALCPDG